MPGYGTPLSLQLPVIGGTEAAAAVSINTALSAVIARLESKVGAADLDLNADVSLKSGTVYSGLTNAQRVAFRGQTVALDAPTNPSTIYVLNGDLHYIDGSGNLVQVTADGAVNVSTTGGITGAGYGTGGVEVNWDSVNSRYQMRSGSGTNDFAEVALSDVLLADGSSNFIRLQSPALASDYTMTLPNAAPASTSLLQMTSAGLVQNTRAPSVDSIGAVTGTFLGLTTLSLDTGPVTVVVDNDITLSGDGRVRFSGDTLYIPASAMRGGVDTFLTGSGYLEYDSFVGAIVAPLTRLGDGLTLVSASVFANKLGGAGDRDLSLCHINAATGAVTTVQTLTSTATGLGTVTYNFADVALTERAYFLRFAGENTDRIYDITVVLNR